MLTITRDHWAKFAPKCPKDYTAALFDNMGLLEDAGILDNERRFCHWAATVYHETGDFREIREDLRYTTTRALRKTWPSRFGSKTDAELKHLLRNPVGLADVVYGCYSNRKKEVIGDVGPGEAFAWRGGGWFNTTFKPSVDRYCNKLGIVPTPSNALDDPVLTLKMAVLEWTETGCNAFADENNIRKVAKAINTGSADSGIEPVGMDGRKAAFARAWKIWGDTGTAEVPAKPIDGKKAVGTLATAAAGVEVTKQVVAVVAPSGPVAVPPAAPVVAQAPAVVSKLPAVDPAAQIGMAKKGIEHATEIKALSTTAAELVTWAIAHPYPVGGVIAGLVAIWIGPALLRRFT